MERDGGTGAQGCPRGTQRGGRWLCGSGAQLRLAAALAGAAMAPSAGAVDAAATALTAAPAMFGVALAAAACASLALLAGIWLAFRLSRDRHALGEALRIERSRGQRLESMLDVWQWTSDAEHRIVTMRPPAGAAPGAWSRAPTTPQLWDCFAVQDEAALRAQLDSGAPLDGWSVQHRAGGGSPQPAVLRARAIRDALGGFAGYHGTLRDLPGSGEPAPGVAPAAQRSGPQAAAIGAGRAPAPTPETDHESFTYTVSHDLRAPIRVVEGFTKIVKEDYGRLLDRVGNDHLDRVLGAAARMNNMVDALLALSKLSSQPLSYQPVNLSQLAGYVADDLRRQAPERQVQLEIEPGMQVLGDPTLLRVVIENLLGNAWKYTAKTATPRIAFARCAGQDQAFTVSDNGAGFDMRFADRLFGVFQRLHSANDFAGTGVGLASVRRIVRRHGGDIWGEGEVNRGARFHFSLPQGDPSR